MLAPCVAYNCKKLLKNFVKLEVSILCYHYLLFVYIITLPKFCSESLFHMQDSNINEHTQMQRNIRKNPFDIFFKF